MSIINFTGGITTTCGAASVFVRLGQRTLLGKTSCKPRTIFWLPINSDSKAHCNRAREEQPSQTLLNPLGATAPTTTTVARFAPVRQDTDNWSISSASKLEPPSAESTYSPVSLVVPIHGGENKVGKCPDNDKHKYSRRTTERFSKGIGYHLGRRRHLLERRRRMADFALAFGVFGLLAAFMDIELVARSVYSKTSFYSNGVRILISLSTVVLLALIISYHAYDVMVFLCEEYIKDWRISVTRRRVIQVIAELLICSIHPVPGVSLFFDEAPHTTTSTLTKTTSATTPSPIRRPFYAATLHDNLSPYLLCILPMIGRLYLALRVLLLHSKMFNDAGSRSIGAMNKVSFDLRFVLKTLMTVCPARTLLFFIFTLWVILSWTLRACELYSEDPGHRFENPPFGMFTNNISTTCIGEQSEDHLGLLNSAWLISVTFLSIGYGDIVPHTSCGRLVAVTTGLMGSACTALLVAVFSRKLEMSKAEKHVLHFMQANKITKRVKNCAANVLRETWLLYKHAKLMPSFNPNRVRAHQRKFLQAIYSLRTIKVKQRELQDKADSLVDLAKLQTSVLEGVADIALRQDSFQRQLETMEQQLMEIKKLVMQQNNSKETQMSPNC
ncbi:unnamed protein product [Calicophoron daubneyi]|uniref:Calmodulin-binding domain-containing protein n=1 Tax=Calicophoron daubneyi TaxID=300641 RepID=A0AAV2SYX1_CALDB